MMATAQEKEETLNGILAVILVFLIGITPLLFQHWWLVAEGLRQAPEVPEVENLPQWPLDQSLPQVFPPDQPNDESPTMEPSIVMFSRPGCPPCEVWWSKHRPSWEKKGWPVKRTEYTGTIPTPYFDVCDGFSRFRVDGMLTYESYKKAGGR
jgi:hypothetical protein